VETVEAISTAVQRSETRTEADTRTELERVFDMHYRDALYKVLAEREEKENNMRVDRLSDIEVVITLKDPATKKVCQKIYINEDDGITFEDVVDGLFQLPKDRCKSTSGGRRGIRCVFARGHEKLPFRPMHGAPIGTGFGNWGEEPKKKRRKKNGRKTPRSR
jgi:hypothetical protein